MHAMILNCLVWFTLHYAASLAAAAVAAAAGNAFIAYAQALELQSSTKLHKLLTYSNQCAWAFVMGVCVCSMQCRQRGGTRHAAFSVWHVASLLYAALAKTNIKLNKLKSCSH